MCCPDNIQQYRCRDRSLHWRHGHVHCGCGCLGKAETIARLEDVRAGLRAELECIENRLASMRKE